MSNSFLASSLPTLVVALGGAIGAGARYQVGLVTARWAGPGALIPWGTLTVNVVGSLVMGALLGWFARGGAESENLRVFLIAGLMGGFTTFSAFSAEMVTMVYRGQVGLAAGYLAASVIAGMAAFAIGLVATQSVA
jgi:CrcB protein